MTCDTEILGAAGRFGVNSLSTAVSGRDEKIQRQKEVLSVPPILQLCRCPGKMSVVLCAGDKAIDLIEYGSWHPTGIQQAFQSGVADA